MKSVLYVACQPCLCNPYAIQQRSKRKAILTHAESLCNHLFLNSIFTQAQSSWCLTSGLKGLRRVARGPSMC